MTLAGVAGILETAGSVDGIDQQLVVRSDWHDGIQETRLIDPAAPRRLTLRWPAPAPGMAQIVRQHYADWIAAGGVAFDYTPPDGGSVMRVVYADDAAPRIRWSAAGGLELVVELEEALASD